MASTREGNYVVPVGAFLYDASQLIPVAEISDHCTREYVKARESGIACASCVESGEGERMLDAANELIFSGFHLVHRFTLLGLWSAFEAAFEDMCVRWLLDTQGAFCSDEALRVKLPVGDLLGLDEKERWAVVLREVRQSRGHDRKPGAAQFEATADAIGLGGALEREVGWTLLTSKAIRNICAHNGGRVDSRFVELCPDFPAKLGDELQVAEGQVIATVSAMQLYLDCVLQRAFDKQGRELQSLGVEWVTDLADLKTWMLEIDVITPL